MGLGKLIGKAISEAVVAPVTIPIEAIKHAEKAFDKALSADDEGTPRRGQKVPNVSDGQRVGKRVFSPAK